MNRIEQKLNETPATTLFHYTSQEGLLGIIREKTLWAANIHYLNDASEFAHSLELIRTKFEHALARERGPWNQLYGTVLERLNQYRHIQIYVASFSENGDLLSQWRGYCPNGAGFSIGFEYAHLKSHLERQGFRLVKCIYDPAEQEGIANDLLTHATQFLPDLEGATQAFMDALVTVGPVLKNPKFSEENEWRMVRGPISMTDARISFRSGKSMLVPYYDFQLATDDNPLRLSTVVVGPTPHMDLSCESAIHLLTREHAQYVSLIPSQVPYRGW